MTAALAGDAPGKPMTEPSTGDAERLRKQLAAMASRAGKASAAKLTPEQRRTRASKAAKAMLATRTPEQIQQNTTKAGKARMARLTPEQRRALAAKGGKANAGRSGKARMAQLTAEERRALAAQGGKTTASKRTAEERREHMRKARIAYWGSMTPEQRSEALKARIRARSPEVQRKIARKAVETRWARVAYSKNPQPADRVFAFLEDYISRKRFAPTVREICHGTGQSNNVVP